MLIAGLRIFIWTNISVKFLSKWSSQTAKLDNEINSFVREEERERVKDNETSPSYISTAMIMFYLLAPVDCFSLVFFRLRSVFWHQQLSFHKYQLIQIHTLIMASICSFNPSPSRKIHIHNAQNASYLVPSILLYVCIFCIGIYLKDILGVRLWLSVFSSLLVGPPSHSNRRRRRRFVANSKQLWNNVFAVNKCFLRLCWAVYLWNFLNINNVLMYFQVEDK